MQAEPDISCWNLPMYFGEGCSFVPKGHAP